ncbi:NYN domain-containing protein [Aquisphaera insulae]|uniref:NYN domain-containing protein n=1 Tax=Aquisphaera insulae TaxID=2712864 RepID=UPI0013EB6AB4|nr:NYN domain-containing protein [Aquisphaera insulae]
MPWLIDGYNLMHASGAVGNKEVTRTAFQQRRRRFLNDLSEAMGPARARDTTVVFDANSPPADFGLESTYKGLHVLFALGDESADARIEQILNAHPVPKSLTVVSSDRAVRRAATRRKAVAIKAEDFLDQLDRMRAENRRDARTDTAGGGVSQARNGATRDATPSPEEAAFWLAEFAGIEEQTGLVNEPDASAPMLTDADIERIRREVEREP